MKAIERHRQSWQGKSDEWLFERLDNELKQKVEEIHRLLAENETLRQLMNDYHESEVKKLRLADVMLRFKLRLNVETWGSYKKGDEDYFYIKLLDEQNGLARFPIDKQWDIVSCEIVNEV